MGPSISILMVFRLIAMMCPKAPSLALEFCRSLCHHFITVLVAQTFVHTVSSIGTHFGLLISTLCISGVNQQSCFVHLLPKEH